MHCHRNGVGWYSKMPREFDAIHTRIMRERCADDMRLIRVITNLPMIQINFKLSASFFRSLHAQKYLAIYQSPHNRCFFYGSNVCSQLHYCLYLQMRIASCRLYQSLIPLKERDRTHLNLWLLHNSSLNHIDRAIEDF